MLTVRSKKRRQGRRRFGHPVCLFTGCNKRPDCTFCGCSNCCFVQGMWHAAVCFSCTQAHHCHCGRNRARRCLQRSAREGTARHGTSTRSHTNQNKQHNNPWHSGWHNKSTMPQRNQRALASSARPPVLLLLSAKSSASWTQRSGPAASANLHLVGL